MTTYLVTGGTGLIGSNVCRALIDGGARVRALVRPESDDGPLRAIGVDAFEGDVRAADDVLRAADGCGCIIHAAAVLGGPAQDLDLARATNEAGSFHVYDAGAAHGIRVVTLSSTPFFDHRATLTEDSPVAATWSDDPYTLTKGAGYVEAKRRAAEEGADINIVIPGGTYGPGLSVKRAMVATSFNRAIRGAVNGKLTEYVTYPVPWVYVEDVAYVCVAAAEKGEAGRTYLAFGAEDASSTASFLNIACEVAGVNNRVAEVRIDADDPDALARYGATLVELARRTFPVPWFDNTKTREALAYAPRPLRAGMETTIRWLRDNGQIN
jgi:nucleoside-diphosphate-sugar epimerase